VPSVLEQLPDGTSKVDQWGQPYDIPLVIQDRLFDAAGQLYYPAVSLNPTINPFWGPEFFGRSHPRERQGVAVSERRADGLSVQVPQR